MTALSLDSSAAVIYKQEVVKNKDIRKLSGRPYSSSGIISALITFVILLGIIGTVFILKHEQQVTSYAAGTLGTNELLNPSFETTGSGWLSPWKFQVNKTNAAATIAQDNTTMMDGSSSAKITITKASTTANYVQLKEQNLSDTQNDLVTLQFWAKADSPRSIKVALQRATSPNTVYASSTVNLTTTWQPYSIVFKAPVSDTTMQAAFNFATATGTVWIDKTQFVDSGAPSHNIYYGVAQDGVPSSMSGLTTFESDAKKPVSLVLFYQQWSTTWNAQYFQPTWMDSVRNHGSIPYITWEPWAAGVGVNQPAYSLSNIINGKFDNYITQWALAAKTWNHPFFLRFAHEMNGTWYPWSEGVNGNTSGQYVQAWIHVHDIFVQNGVTNVTWVWCPNVENKGSVSLSHFYPGDAYVDWTCIDGYNWGTTKSYSSWQYFDSVFGLTYQDVTSFASKPMMVGETASVEQGANKASWINDAYAYKLPMLFPKIKAITWFNNNKESDWRIESSPAAQSAFANVIQEYIYMSNNYGTISQTPIPAP